MRTSRIVLWAGHAASNGIYRNLIECEKESTHEFLSLSASLSPYSFIMD